MKKVQMTGPVRLEVRALLTLSPWLLLSLLLAAVLWTADLTATSGLFQSPPEQPLTPTETMPAIPEMPTLTPTVPITLTAPPLGPVEPITTVAPITPTAPVTVPITTTTPTALPSLQPEAPATEAVPTETVVPTAIPESGEAEPTEGEHGRYPEEDVGLKFEWGMLFDSVALGVSYGWLCCGILIVLGLPVFFVVLWVASKRRQENGP